MQASAFSTFDVEVFNFRLVSNINDFYNFDKLFRRCLVYQNSFFYFFFLHFGFIKNFFFKRRDLFLLSRSFFLRFRVAAVRDAQKVSVVFSRVYLQNVTSSVLSRFFFKRDKKQTKSKDFCSVSFLGIKLNPLVLWKSFFMVAGKTDAADFILIKVFLQLLRLKHFSISTFFLFYFLRTLTYVEVRSVLLRRRRSLVPFLLSIHRQLFVSLKTFLGSILLKLKQVRVRSSFSEKAFKEIKGVLFGRADMLAKINEIKVLAVSNRANANYRW